MNSDANMDRFLEFVEPTPSPWLEKARWRAENREWLRTAADIALRCLRVMRAQGITQKELAERMDVSPQQVSKILKGKENLTLETIEKLEKALGISLIGVPALQEEIAPVSPENAVPAITDVSIADQRSLALLLLAIGILAGAAILVAAFKKSTVSNSNAAPDPVLPLGTSAIAGAVVISSTSTSYTYFESYKMAA